jgi:hypothetical protein
MENQQPPEQKNKMKRLLPYLVVGIFALVALVSLYFTYQANMKTATKPPEYKKVSAVVGTDIPVSVRSDGTSMYFEHNGERLSLTNRITDLMVGTEYTFILTNNSGVKQGVFIPALKESVVVETTQPVSISVRFDNPGTYYFMGNVYQPGWDGLKSGFEVGMDTIEPPGVTASAGTATPTPTATASTGTCQCDLSVVKENNCVAPAVPVCQSQMVCVCNAFVGAEPTSTVTPTPTLTLTPTASPTPTTVAGGAFTSCADVTEIPQTECQALVDLYNSTNGPGWTNSAGWLQTDTPCSWNRVTCNGPRISELNLSSYNLRGTIPTSIGNLNLDGLYMSNNRISGTIPSGIGNMSYLRRLYLNENQLTGSIPTSLGNLTDLEILELKYNQLSGTIPSSLANLTAIIGMNVTFFTNSLTGVENQTVCPWLTAHSASNWWQLQTPPIATDPCAGSGSAIEEAQPVAAKTVDIGKPTKMPVPNQNILAQIVLFFQQLLRNVFGTK